MLGLGQQRSFHAPEPQLLMHQQSCFQLTLELGEIDPEEENYSTFGIKCTLRKKGVELPNIVCLLDASTLLGA